MRNPLLGLAFFRPWFEFAPLRRILYRYMMYVYFLAKLYMSTLSQFLLVNYPRVNPEFLEDELYSLLRKVGHVSRQ